MKKWLSATLLVAVIAATGCNDAAKKTTKPAAGDTKPAPTDTTKPAGDTKTP
jgi:hypothetical protein